MRIKVKQAKRCSACGRLVDSEAMYCPNCNGTEFSYSINPENPTNAPESASPNGSKRKGLIIAASCIAGLMLLGLIINKIIDYAKLNKPITEPLDYSYVFQKDNSMEGFYSMYWVIDDQRSEMEYNKDQYAKVTYREMYDFYSKYCINDDFINQVIADANSLHESSIRQPYISKVRDKIQEWNKYVENHDVNKYLRITIQTGYEKDGYQRHPKYWYSLYMPQGSIRDCYVTVTNNFNNSPEYRYLSDLQRINGVTYTYWPGVDNEYFWDTYDVTYTINRVILNNGTVIRDSDINNVPLCIKQYQQNPCLENEESIILNLIDNQYKTKSEYVKLKIEDYLKEKDPDCFFVYKNIFDHNYDKIDELYEDEYYQAIQ